MPDDAAPIRARAAHRLPNSVARGTLSLPRYRPTCHPGRRKNWDFASSRLEFPRVDSPGNLQMVHSVLFA